MGAHTHTHHIQSWSSLRHRTTRGVPPQLLHPHSATVGSQALPAESHSVSTAVSRAAWRHILDDYPGVKSIWIRVDAGQVRTLEKALAVAAMMVVVVM